MNIVLIKISVVVFKMKYRKAYLSIIDLFMQRNNTYLVVTQRIKAERENAL